MPKLQAKELTVRYGRGRLIEHINVQFEEGRICALIGPASAGKTTLLRVFNRLLEERAGLKVSGIVTLDGVSIYDLDILELTRRVGMVFPEPTPFAGSIEDNIAYGLRIRGEKDKGVIRDAVEAALREVDLWNLRNSLHMHASGLTIEQQQRLCIARTLALKPEVVLMDEPLQCIDAGARSHVEGIIEEMRGRYTVVMSSTNMELVGRISDDAAFILDGELLEFGPTEVMFTRPRHKRTINFITGRLT